ncbi:DMT family transporter [Marimonas lutisalis]|uniref:DMT family transporter n=1 Tax=Marimonas lutisalis TaxID=2545756 RepID=UPI0010F9EF87|nr:DMT family transporter [Marimonas lutisalis]
MTTDRPLLGILLMLGFCIVAPLADAVAKILGQTIPVAQLVFIRFAVQVLLLAPLIVLTRRPWRMRGRVLRLTILRTFMHILGIGLMVSALKYLPLADAVAIAFVMPFILLVLGKILLGEEVGPRRLLACVVGFAGTMLVIQPSFTAIGWPALLPLGVALNFAFFMLVTRQIAKDTDPIGLQAVSGTMAVAFMAPVLLLGSATNMPLLHSVAPSAMEWALLAAIGGLGTLGHLLMTWSLRYAPSATLAPMQYLEIPVAALLGWMIFLDWPNDLALAGICITVAAGLYVMLTEKASARPRAPRAPERPARIPSPAE